MSFLAQRKKNAVFFSSPGTRCYLEYMRIWQRPVVSSPVFLSHHLFGCARIHWNVFTRCQNSGNSTLFGSRERKRIKWSWEWSGRENVGECLSQLQERQVAAWQSPRLALLLSGSFSDPQFRNGCYAGALDLQQKEHHVILQTVSEPFMFPSRMFLQRKKPRQFEDSMAWEILSLAQVHFCDGFRNPVHP